MRNQIVLGLLSEAGGVGKTTLAVNIAYEWSCRGHSVAILDLDSNNSLKDFVGLQDNLNSEETIVKIFRSDFAGDYPLKTVLERDKWQVCLGSALIVEETERLVARKRREYVLAKLLKQYPLPHQLVILDCRAGIDLMAYNVIAACTHILVPLEVGVKILTAPNLVQGILLTAEDLELEPPPQILGLIPNRYNKDAALHKQLIEQLPEIAEQLKVKLYSPLRQWQHLNNSAVCGQPLKMLRPGDPMCKVFAEIVNDLETIIE